MNKENKGGEYRSWERPISHPFSALEWCWLTSPLIEIDYCSFVCGLTTWINSDFGVLMKKPKASENVAMGSQKKCD